ncbi:hypothetical protein KOR34_09080 [Posidoniimonas corsicana]|uniref:Uncharacterized protein n=1 Tax=Posidoniimonas corsicana TaxID=1938618 RepID=A0A5C5VCN3_9BACT|nr:hypothetical protein KOR34_09080 [Posidoniimonas corsicana]
MSLRKVNRLAPGQVNSLVLAVEWGTPPGVAPMAAIVHTPEVEVTLGSGQVVTSRPMTFLLTSEPGVKFARPGPSAELHRKLRELPGGRSPGVEEVMRAVRGRRSRVAVGPGVRAVCWFI